MGKGREREREEEKGRMGERAMGTECLCKTKDREESGEADSKGGGGMKQPGWQQERGRERQGRAETR